MRMCVVLKALVTLAAAKAVSAHTVFTTLFVDGLSSGDGTCVRMPLTPNNSTFPLNDLAGTDMACGYDGMKGVQRVCPVNAASKLGFLFREYADASQPGVIDPGHKGPCAVYLKPVSSAIKDAAVGNGWFKIWDEGYDNKTQQWCTEKLIQNNGMLSVNIPSDLAAGYYLARPELLALHQADKTPPNPQFYVGCAQIYLNSTQTARPKETVCIPGHITKKDPSVLFNIYEPKWPYLMPGPAVYSGGGGQNITVALANAPEQNEGLLPENVVVTNANWWGVELESYTTEDGCWNASKTCFEELDGCYNTAPPTGHPGCRLWESKCTKIQTNCNDGNFNGPPNKGAHLRQEADPSQSPSSLVAGQKIPSLYRPVQHPRSTDDPYMNQLTGVFTDTQVFGTTGSVAPVTPDVTVTVFGITTSILPYSSPTTTAAMASITATSAISASISSQNPQFLSAPANIPSASSATPIANVSNAISETNAVVSPLFRPPSFTSLSSTLPMSGGGVPITLESINMASILAQTSQATSSPIPSSTFGAAASSSSLMGTTSSTTESLSSNLAQAVTASTTIFSPASSVPLVVASSSLPSLSIASSDVATISSSSTISSPSIDATTASSAMPYSSNLALSYPIAITSYSHGINNPSAITGLSSQSSSSLTASPGVVTSASIASSPGSSWVEPSYPISTSPPKATSGTIENFDTSNTALSSKTTFAITPTQDSISNTVLVSALNLSIISTSASETALNVNAVSSISVEKNTLKAAAKPPSDASTSTSMTMPSSNLAGPSQVLNSAISNSVPPSTTILNWTAFVPSTFLTSIFSSGSSSATTSSQSLSPMTITTLSPFITAATSTSVQFATISPYLSSYSPAPASSLKPIGFALSATSPAPASSSPKPQTDNSDPPVVSAAQCGPAGGNQTCLDAMSGKCCSENGRCGGDTMHCGIGCQLPFGRCGIAYETQEGMQYGKRRHPHWH